MSDRHTHDDLDLQSPVHEGSGHETTDISTRPLVLFLIGLVVSLVLVLAVLRVQFSFFEADQDLPRPGPPPLPTLADGPRREPTIQAAPELDMDELRLEDKARLNTLQWNDPGKSAVIPIDDAMKIVVAKGLPTRKRDK
jgi:hypothetical protein